MLHFLNDYSEGAAPEIIESLAKSNGDFQPGYGEDEYCAKAKEKIRSALKNDRAEIFFLTGGTQTNKTVISALLKSFEGVVAAESAHVSTHEAGAIESSGHKVITLPEKFGKISAEDLQGFLSDFYADKNHGHTVFPGMVYLSHPTEYGTLYSAAELEEIHGICEKFGLPLYIDGARLLCGVTAAGADVTLENISSLCDAFYIGGTKAGALCGEAVVFPRGNAPARFFTHIKQQGALLAKGRLLGLQFNALFTDRLYERLAKNALETAEIIRNGFAEKGYEFYAQNPTNQIFVIMSDEKIKELSEKVVFGVWQKRHNGRSVVRFVTSFATSAKDAAALIRLI